MKQGKGYRYAHGLLSLAYCFKNACTKSVPLSYICRAAFKNSALIALCPSHYVYNRNGNTRWNCFLTQPRQFRAGEKLNTKVRLLSTDVNEKRTAMVFVSRSNRRRCRHCSSILYTVGTRSVPHFSKQDSNKQGLHPRKKSSFFTKVTECLYSGYFDLMSILAQALVPLLASFMC